MKRRGRNASLLLADSHPSRALNFLESRSKNHQTEISIKKNRPRDIRIKT